MAEHLKSCLNSRSYSSNCPFQTIFSFKITKMGFEPQRNPKKEILAFSIIQLVCCALALITEVIHFFRCYNCRLILRSKIYRYQGVSLYNAILFRLFTLTVVFIALFYIDTLHIPYMRHYNPRFVYFLPCSSLRFIL